MQLFTPFFARSRGNTATIPTSADVASGDSGTRGATGTRRRTAVLEVIGIVLVLVMLVLGYAPAANASETYSAFMAYASAPGEVLGKTSAGWQKLTAAEAAVVPADAVVVRFGTAFMQVRGETQLYKVSYETVTPITERHWVYEGSPTPKIVDRMPAIEYYSYASAPQEILVRTPLGHWRQAWANEYKTIDAATITRRVNTYFTQAVGEAQIHKVVNGVSTPISAAQWRGEGSPTPMVPATREVGSNPFAAHAPYVDPTYPSVAAAADLRARGNNAGAAAVDRISAHAGTRWVGDWNPVSKVRATVAKYTQDAEDAGQTGTLVLYAIPGRDCSGHSAGGLTADQYDDWVNEIAAGIAGKRVAVVLEPDALMQLGRCPEIQGDRAGLLSYAAKTLTDAGATVYIDAGSSYSVPAAEMAKRLLAAGVEHVRGFATNVSNYKPTAQVRDYAESISEFLGGKHYVIDTSRNGKGDNGEWCNPRGRGLGALPGRADHGHQDANLWIKTIGASDGACNGGPKAGAWWDEIAIELAINSAF
ncbi:glycoside hydrolase family 6 protein [Diaminobutyricimonas sp. TR449]|uniref:glycoside hydrolase family 6 protein n=1 Tax=Diaminobutyricimonas sp. TR449 TaxID=2708076 RepID=UPI00141E5B89|nr:glycoside hydrolase family 6 protein [Diaminobutyricimonas sp. TR449]